MPMFCFSRFVEVFVHQDKLQKGLLDVLINFPILHVIVSNMFYSTCAMISLNCDLAKPHKYIAFIENRPGSNTYLLGIDVRKGVTVFSVK